MPIGSHDWSLVLLSVLIAIAAAHTALDLAGRIQASRGGVRHAWTAAAAIAMGGGIWAMHFVAMLAYQMPMRVAYEGGTTAASLLLAIGAAGTGLLFASGSSPSRSAVGGVLMGAGIAGMHYLGMAAMRMDATVRYDRTLVAVSLLIAIGASMVGLWVAFRNTRTRDRLVAAAALGTAVAGMHYTAMAAAVFEATSPSDHAHGLASLEQTQLAAAVAAATLVILFLASVAALFDRRFGAMAEREAAALRESEARFRTLYRETPLPLYSLGADGRLEQVSDAWLDLLGHDRADVLGRPLTDFMDPASARAYAAGRPGDGRPGDGREDASSEAEHHFRTRDGRILDVTVRERALPAADGGLRILGALDDRTERKRLEADLRQAQKVEAIGQLTGGLAHDFNNLLAVIIGNMELLARRVGDDKRAARMVSSASAAATRGAALTQRMLAFARRQDLKPAAVDVSALVEGMEDLLARSLSHSVRLERRLPAGLPRAHVDANQLELALVNLAVNARDAMPAGGVVTVAARHEPGDDRSEGFVVVSVSDTGEGMDEATLARAADPFFTTKGVGKGTGLGLSMVQGLAVQSGGRLAIHSTPGAGTTAELWLPAAAVGAGAAAEPVAPPPPAAVADPEPARDRPLTVLAVDDDPLVLMGTAAMLEDLGHRVVEAENAHAALAHLEAGGAVDVLITDYAMPGMTGEALARAARALRPGLPVVLATGFAELPAGDIDDAVRLSKPFHQSDLAAALRQASAAAAEAA